MKKTILLKIALTIAILTKDLILFFFFTRKPVKKQKNRILLPTIMGCLKLSYNQAGEALENFPLFLEKGLGKKGIAEKNRLSSSRYGFNGKESTPEWNNVSGAIYDYGFRIYDARLGRFLSVDPLTKNYAMLTPYQFASNTPIQAIDLDGLEAVVIIHSPWFTKQIRKALNNGDIEEANRLTQRAIHDYAKDDFQKEVFQGEDVARVKQKTPASGIIVYGVDDNGKQVFLFEQLNNEGEIFILRNKLSKVQEQIKTLDDKIQSLHERIINREEGKKIADEADSGNEKGDPSLGKQFGELLKKLLPSKLDELKEQQKELESQKGEFIKDETELQNKLEGLEGG